MTKQGSTGQMQKLQQLQACRTSASPGEQQQGQQWGSTAHGGWEQGSASSGELVARQVLGTEGQEGRECEPGRGTGSLQCTQQTPDPEACPLQGTQTFLLSFVSSNVAEMLECGVRTGWKAHGEGRLRLSTLKFTTARAQAGHNKVQVSTWCKDWQCTWEVLEHSDVGRYLGIFLEGQAPSVCPHRVPRDEHQLY